MTDHDTACRGAAPAALDASKGPAPFTPRPRHKKLLQRLRRSPSSRAGLASPI